ncbi:MAG TPA: hypothetical protein VKB86_16180, partial [Pyrinomonadaceae bacterium]|nr:hypothetical protein [Pyrinomonadaceae bacterium]
LILILLSFQVAYPQTRKLRNSQRSIAADRAWFPFFKRLRTAVKRRDRASLKEMMIPEFFYTLGHHIRSQVYDSREDAFKYWDEPYNPGWKELDRTLAKGAVPEAAWSREGNKKKSPPTRVAPPAANIRWNIDRGLVPYIAEFEYRNGCWYFTLFDACCD